MMENSEGTDCVLKKSTEISLLEEENKKLEFKYVNGDYEKYSTLEDFTVLETGKYADEKPEKVDLQKSRSVTDSIINGMVENLNITEDAKFSKKFNSLEGIDTTYTSSDLDLTEMTSSCSNSFKEDFKSNANENVSEIKFVSIENGETMEIFQMRTSTPKSENSSYDFITEDYVNYQLSIDLCENSDTDEYLDKTIDEAIKKYQSDAEKRERYKEVSVQTTELFPIDCRCNLYKLKTKEKENIISVSPESPPAKKLKFDFLEDSIIGNNAVDCQLKQPKSTNSKDNYSKDEMTETFRGRVKPFIDKEKPNANFNPLFNATPRLRIGLSKRTKLQPLHRK